MIPTAFSVASATEEGPLTLTSASIASPSMA
jgi:hypothetical protein